MDLGDGSAVRLTTARYYTPTGRSIQKPYSGNGNENYYQEYEKRIANGELLSKDSIQVIDSLKYTTPEGKTVYGGGGIIPDVFIPINTTSYLSPFYFNSINNFSFDYVDANRKQLEKLNITAFIDDFDADEAVFTRYLSDIEERITPTSKDKKNLKRYLKASIASVLFGDLGFYRIIHQEDKMLQKVLELESINE
jgi:carboxyl-terminal processing protease|tara:strand:- start:188 stop:772 length:585 start_codon:yes stop_codon:yes gene_type:complete